MEKHRRRELLDSLYARWALEAARSMKRYDQRIRGQARTLTLLSISYAAKEVGGAVGMRKDFFERARLFVVASDMDEHIVQIALRELVVMDEVAGVLPEV